MLQRESQSIILVAMVPKKVSTFSWEHKEAGSRFVLLINIIQIKLEIDVWERREMCTKFCFEKP